ncbi:MAG: LUD domain-containing protein, partial [Alphaproteobacteria bacterium]
MLATSNAFRANARVGLANPTLQSALGKMKVGFPTKRAEAVSRLPEFDALRDQARDIKNHVLENLDWYLERFERRVTEAGGHVHWARTPEEAREIVLGICRRLGARTVTKGKSMIAEEIGLNAHLEKHAIEPVETDLGEYIIQLRNEAPSHIIAPAVHLTKDAIEADFRRAHSHLDARRDLTEPQSLVAEA